MVAGVASAQGLLFAHRLLEKWLFGAIFCGRFFAGVQPVFCYNQKTLVSVCL